MKFYFIIVLLSVSAAMSAQPTTMTVKGRYLTDRCGDTVYFKGINYPAYGWGYDAGSEVVAQIAQTGANAVRIVWYANPDVNATAYTLANLDTVLSRCARYDMIPVLELHDQTCADNTTALANLALWWTSSAVVEVLQKHQQYLVINYANEALHWGWNGGDATQTTRYQTAYNAAVQAIRGAGLDMPIMIDAPDCGTNIDVFTSVAANLIAADPRQNLLFSGHAYWYSFAGNSATTAKQKLQTAINSGIPLVLGEIANYQSDATDCQYVLPYEQLLTDCETLGIGWFAWAWYQDGCASRQISTNGNYSSLTAFGQVIVNNATYGTQTAIRSRFLTGNGLCTTAIEVPVTSGFHLLTFDGYWEIASTTGQETDIVMLDMAGREVLRTALTSRVPLRIARPQTAGLYWLRAGTETFRLICL